MFAIIKDEERCISCALCAVRCPVERLTRFLIEGPDYANIYQRKARRIESTDSKWCYRLPYPCYGNE
jgi:Fe-S-cluster-containing hydrogenase component 2